MWVGYVDALKVYFNVMVREWISRGFQNNMPLYDIDESEYSIIPTCFNGKETLFAPTLGKTFPPWFSWQPFIYSHRCALIRKDPQYYGPKFWDDQCPYYINLGYLWPSHMPASAFYHFELSMLDPIGAGAPAQYRISKEDAHRWNLNRTVNPLTNRAIKIDGPIYKDYEKAYNAHFISKTMIDFPSITI